MFILGAIISVNLGEYLDAGSVENARAYIIAFAVLFLAAIVAVSTSLILDEIHNKNN